jgi:hypothetical protein
MIKQTLSLAATIIILCNQAFAQKPGSHKALDFNGSSDYVNIPDHSSINPSAAITVEAWINADSYGSNFYSNSIFCKHGWASGQKGYVLRCGDNGKLSFNIANASGVWVEAVSASVMVTGQWYHVAGTFDGDTIAVYINGILQAFTLYSGSISVSTGLDGKIGDLAYGGKRWFDGQIDELKIWGEAISESNLRNWMCRKVTKTHPNYSSLRAYWKMDDGSGKTASDSSGNKNVGTLLTPSWVISGAAIGDTVVNTYAATDISMTSLAGHVMSIKNITGSPSCVHLYRVNGLTDNSLSNGMYATIDSANYFGAYMPKKTGSDFTVHCSYEKLNSINKINECSIDLLQKPMGGGGNWATTPSKLFMNGDSLVIDNSTQAEFMVVMYPSDSAKVIWPGKGKPFICAGDSLMLTAAGSDSFTYQWYKDGSIMTGKTKRSIYTNTGGKFKVTTTRLGTSCTFESLNLEVSMKQNPIVSLAPFKGVCQNLDTIVLLGGTPKGGIFTEKDIVKDTLFLPSQHPPGKYNMIYLFTDTTTCFASDTETLEVIAKPTLSNSGIIAFCNDADSVLCFGSGPAGGFYSGKYIRNNYFFLDSVNHIAGLYAYRYTYSDANGCISFRDDTLLVKASSPVFLLPITNTCIKDAPITLGGSPNGGQYAGNGVSGNSFDPAKAGIGKHNITYTFTNKENCSSTASQTASVFKNTTVTWGYQITACENGDSIKMQQGSPNGGFFSGTGVSSVGYFKPLIAKAGTHAIYYTFIDTNGCFNKAISSALVHDTIDLFIGTIDPVCPSIPPFALSYVSPQGGTYSGTGVQSNEFDPKVGSGSYSIKYQLTNTNNCTSNSNLSLTVVKTDSMSITLPSSVCINSDPIQLKAFPAGGSFSGPGVIGNYISPAIAGSGKHKVIYIIFESHKCIASDTAEIVVSAIPKVSLTSFISVCDNDPEFILSGGLPVLGGKYFVNGSEADRFNPIISKKGLFQIKYKVVNEYGCSDSTEKKLRVNEAPVKPIITIQSGTLSSNANKGFQWFDLAGIISGANQQNYTPPADGSYYVQVTNDSGCSSISDTVLFKKTGISEDHLTGLSIYPNPTDGTVQIEFSIPVSNADISVFNLLGERVLEVKDFNGTKAKMAIGYLSEGIYMIKVLENERSAIQKIVLMK